MRSDFKLILLLKLVYLGYYYCYYYYCRGQLFYTLFPAVRDQSFRFELYILYYYYILQTEK